MLVKGLWTGMAKKTRRLTVALAIALVASCATTGAGGPTPTVEAVPGQAAILLGSFDLASIGYRSDEFFISGSATSYQLTNGQAAPAQTSPYVTRIVVTRPTDPGKFNGTVIVEWMNVSGGQDAPTEWIIAHRELARSGYVHVGVSSQLVGVEGGRSVLGGASVPLKRANPERYGRLSHPGDTFSFDIFSQAGRALRGPNAALVLGGLKPKRLIAAGESQSAQFLTTYVNDVDPLARVYDGFLVHSRFGGASPLATGSMVGAPGALPQVVPFRSDLRVPVLTVLTETDVAGGGLAGYFLSRVPDTNHLRVWEVAGAAHADNYLFGLGMRDAGSLSIAQLASGFAPSTSAAGSTLKLPANPGLAHHFVVQAAISQLDHWLRTGKAPPQAPPLSMTTGERPTLVLDANGLATGGVRTPWVDVPTIRMSGSGNSGGPLAFLAGVGQPFDAATLAKLYPGGKDEYLRRFQAALDKAISTGFILPADRMEILGIAAASWPVAS